jgi:hypothetical protein
MTINIKLSNVESENPDTDPLRRTWWGYRPTSSPQEVFEHNRGMWYLRADRAVDERWLTFSFAGKIVVVCEIDGVETLQWRTADPRRPKQALTGRALEPGHPVWAHFIDRPIAPARNPVTYIDDPEPRRLEDSRRCACGCGTPVAGSKHFAPGHDQRAVRERIARQWGDTLGFIQWFDEVYGTKAP